MIKLSPFLLTGFFLLQRRWSALAGILGSLAALTAISITIAGPQVIEAFVRSSVGSSIPAQIDWSSNASLAAFVHRAVAFLGYSFLELPFRLGLWFACLGLLALVSRRRYHHTSEAFALLLCLWIAVMLLGSPITWEHRLVWLLPGLAVSVSTLERMDERSAVRWALCVGGLYSILCFENITLTRFGQWQFQSGWWVFGGDYLRAFFVADLRLLGLAGFCVLQGALLSRMRVEEQRSLAGGQQHDLLGSLAIHGIAVRSLQSWRTHE